MVLNAPSVPIVIPDNGHLCRNMLDVQQMNGI
jgi:hypothetical protein